MKNLIKAAIVAVAMCLPTATMAKITHLLPRPQQIEAKSGAAFALGRTVTITDPTNCTALHMTIPLPAMRTRHTRSTSQPMQ